MFRFRFKFISVDLEGAFGYSVVLFTIKVFSKFFSGSYKFRSRYDV